MLDQNGGQGLGMDRHSTRRPERWRQSSSFISPFLWTRANLRDPSSQVVLQPANGENTQRYTFSPVTSFWDDASVFALSCALSEVVERRFRGKDKMGCHVNNIISHWAYHYVWKSILCLHLSTRTHVINFKLLRAAGSFLMEPSYNWEGGHGIEAL